jgi:hypothetical protein
MGVPSALRGNLIRIIPVFNKRGKKNGKKAVGGPWRACGSWTKGAKGLRHG